MAVTEDILNGMKGYASLTWMSAWWIVVETWLRYKGNIAVAINKKVLPNDVGKNAH